MTKKAVLFSNPLKTEMLCLQLDLLRPLMARVFVLKKRLARQTSASAWSRLSIRRRCLLTGRQCKIESGDMEAVLSGLLVLTVLPIGLVYFVGLPTTGLFNIGGAA